MGSIAETKNYQSSLKKTGTLIFSMNAFGIRSFEATTLSLWLGVLACLLGCATPAKASQSPSQTAAAQCPERDAAGDSCCQHSHNPRRSERNHHAMSCCPSETALTQKQNLTLPALAIFVAVLTLVQFDASLTGPGN